jgi:hypothetical protein
MPLTEESPMSGDPLEDELNDFDKLLRKRRKALEDESDDLESFEVLGRSH